MKKLSIFLFILFSRECFCQSVIGCYPFTVTVNKTSNIIFPYAVRSVDRGSRDILVQKAGGTENVLQLKAARENFPVTTLSVITSDGKLYPFLISYDSMPQVMNLSFVKGDGKPYVRLSDETEDASAMENDADTVLGKPSFLDRHKTSMLMELALKSIYIKDSLLWFHFRISNRSLIPFEPDYIHFFIRDRAKAKRTAMQQAELMPAHISKLSAIAGKQVEEFVCGFRLFTIARNKKLLVDINESAGGRLLTLAIENKTLLKARQAN
ncbi:MAG TPA: conjugative transposon protein TraN [Puia sp.]|nr:conjugative transposon protein TraN [Puia sp.]